MKKKFLQIVSTVLAVVMILPTAALAADYTIKVGESKDISVDMGSTFSTINWESSDTGVATVAKKQDNRKATVTGVAEGEATITATRVQNGTAGDPQTFTFEVIDDTAKPGENETPMVPVDPEEPETPDEKDDFEITCDDDLTVYTDGGKTIQLKVEGYDDVMWDSDDDSVASVSSSGVVTGHTAGKSVTIYAYSKDKNDSCTVRVVKREVESISVSGTPKKEYTEGESFSMGSASVVAHYNDGTSETVTGYTVKPSGILAQEDTSVTITYAGKTCEVTGIKVTADSVTGIEIVSPANGSKYTVGDTIKRSDVSIKVTRSGGDKYTISAADYSEITFSPSGALTASDKALTVSYSGKTASIAISVAEKVTKTLTDVKVYTAPTKTVYTTNEKLDLTGLVLAVKYSDSTNNQYVTKTYSQNSSRISANVEKFTREGTQNVTVTYTDEFGSGSATFEVTVGTFVDVTGFANTTGNKAVLDEDAKVKIDDELDWEDLFESVSFKYKNSSGTTKYKEIKDEDDLEDWLGAGAKMYVNVSGKDGSDADTVEEDDIKNGKVSLKLYLEYGGKTYSLSFDMPISGVACTVTIYRSATSSSVTGDSKVFDDLEEALESLEDEDDIIDEYNVGSSYEKNFAVKIKLGEDQDIEGFEFAPDHEHKITIDLNGCELTLDSEWIEYDSKNEDIEIVITNTNDDDHGTLVYDDLDASLVVTDGSNLKFTEGVIPMDSDAECTVSIYKNGNSTSSSALLKTKVYDSLKEALEDLEDHDDALDIFDIDDDYEDSFVVRMKLGKDQNLTTFIFAPDYDTTVYIDLNGYTLKLKSEWIDYGDCDDLVVKINNTNKDKKATLTYTDLSNTSLSLAYTDSALTFEEDKIPGIYKVEVVPVTNGKVTVNPNKDTVAHGGTVTFTITPNEGYEISSVKDGTKTISAAASGYTVSSKGVGTYKKENITADVKLTVTFKKGTASSSTSSAANWTNPFTDISKSAQYYNAVAFVCSEGLFNGMTATKLEPTTTMTRAMFVTVLGRLAGVDVAKFSGTSFTDVSRSDQQISWAAPYIEWAVQNGITNGTGNGKFSPNDPITHQQMYLFMYRYAMFIENYNTPLTNASLSGIRDADEIADWAVEGVKFASQNSILITTGGKLTPTENALRCELAMLLHGFCTKVLDKNG